MEYSLIRSNNDLGFDDIFGHLNKTPHDVACDLITLEEKLFELKTDLGELLYDIRNNPSITVETIEHKINTIRGKL